MKKQRAAIEFPDMKKINDDTPIQRVFGKIVNWRFGDEELPEIKHIEEELEANDD